MMLAEKILRAVEQRDRAGRCRSTSALAKYCEMDYRRMLRSLVAQMELGLVLPETEMYRPNVVVTRWRLSKTGGKLLQAFKEANPQGL
jgi:hypothetical protein